MKITDVDYFENDAFLQIEDKKFYFQFKNDPTIGEALDSLLIEGKLTAVTIDGVTYENT